MPVMTYKYGTRSSVQLPEAAIDQLRLAHRMRNALVSAHLEHEQRVKDLWSQYPEVAGIETQLVDAEAKVARLAEQARAEHSQDRTIATCTATAAALREARAGVRALKQARREAIGQAYLILKPQLEALKADHRDRIKSVWQDYAAQGLYWGTYNALRDDHRRAVNRITASRKAGQPAALRYKRWQGEGTLTVQLQRADVDPVRSPATLAAGSSGKWRNVFGLTRVDNDPATVAAMSDSQRKNTGADRATLRFNIGGRQVVEIPVTAHRPLPPDADVIGAQLTLRRVGSRAEISVAVTVVVPDPDPVEGLPPVALHTGWRQRPDGSVRVGTWASPARLSPPASLADIVVTHSGGAWGEVVMPASWLDQAGQPPALRGRRDIARAPVIEKLASWLDEHPQPAADDQPELTGAAVRRWRAPTRLAALALQWRDNPPAGGQEMAALLEAWRKQDKHLWNVEANTRKKLCRRRDDAWQRVAAWLAGQAGVLVVDDTQLSALRRRPNLGDEDPVLPGEQQRKARARAALAAPGYLRQVACQAATKRGVTVQEVPSAHLTRTCPHCRAVGDTDPRYAASASVTCPSCARTYDQDRAATLLMLDRERPSAVAQVGPRPQN